MTMDLQALKDELDNDPEALGYAGTTDVEAGRLINKPDRTADIETVPASALAGAIDLTEYDDLGNKERAYLDMLISAGEVENTQKVRQQLRDLFPAGSASRPGIRQALKRPGSRADELGFGRVTPSHIAQARQLP